MKVWQYLATRPRYWIVNRPKAVVLVFLLLTAGFATGLNNITTASGTDQFAEDVDAYQTNEQVEEEFSASFAGETETTLLLQKGENVLSRQGLLRMLETQDRLLERPSLRATSTRSAAQWVARELNPSATTTDDQIRAVERATDSEIRTAVRQAATDPAFTSLIGEDFNRQTSRATAALGVTKHDLTDDDSLANIQVEARRVADAAGGDIRIFGEGIIDYENGQVLRDSLKASIPVVIVLLLLFLAVSYRDPFDLFLGIVSLGMALVWTFGFLGLAGIPFSQLQVSLPPLLLAIGVDFGIHTINRYREEFDGDIAGAIDRTVSHLLLAFFMVLTTSVIGFSANLTSGLSPIADFGLVAAAGITAVALIFGVFLPAAKLIVERIRERTRLPAFDSRPLGAEDSLLGRILPLHLSITSRLPIAFLLLMVMTAGVAGYYGKDIGSSFEDEDMLPPEDLPDYLDYLPGPMGPGTYTTTENLHFIEDNFETTDDDTVIVYVEGPMYRDHALEAVYRAGTDPPSSFVVAGDRQARAESILTVIADHADESSSFAALVARNDRNDNGIPDDNLKAIYSALLASPYEDRTREYLSADYRGARVVYSVETDASKAAVTADATTVADRYRFEAIETGGTVVFQRVTDEIFQSAIKSLITALTLATVFLLLVFFLLERRAALGLVTLLPIVLTIAFLVASMRYLEIPFNTLTATLLSITVGVGIDYSIHVVHRFVDEFDASGEALESARITLQGTGGALFGTTLTTISAGLALYTLSITPILIQFGILISLSVVYSFLVSIVFLPVLLVVWTRWEAVRDPWISSSFSS